MAFLGGFVAQEVIKGCTGKFVPLHQWLIGEFIECIPIYNLHSEKRLSSCKTSERYMGATKVIGEKLQDKLCNLRVFVVGAGAIGKFLMNEI